MHLCIDELVRLLASHMSNAKPLPEPMMTNHQFVHKDTPSMKLISKHMFSFKFGNVIYKMLANLFRLNGMC